MECCRCGTHYSPLLAALEIGSHARKESNFQGEVVEAVIDINIRRLIEARSIDISLGGIHNLVVGSETDEHFEAPIDTEQLRGLMADGTEVKQYRGGRGELRIKEHLDRIKQLVGIKAPADDFELLKEHDKEKEQVRAKYEDSKREIEQLIETFRDRGYQHAASYLQSLTRRLFTNIELWLKTGVIAPRTVSLLERVFRELGRQLKKIAWGWKDTTPPTLSKMILLKQYSKDKWEQYWKDKLGIHGNFNVEVTSVDLTPCKHF